MFAKIFCKSGGMRVLKTKISISVQFSRMHLVECQNTTNTPKAQYDGHKGLVFLVDDKFKGKPNPNALKILYKTSKRLFIATGTKVVWPKSAT